MPDYLSRMIFENFNLPPDIALACVDKQGRYWITSDGRLLSVCRDSPRYLKFFDNGNGYLYVDFDNERHYLHRLLAVAFNQDKEKQKLIDSKNFDVHHLDFDKSNNSLENLCILTPKEHRAIHAQKNKLDREVCLLCQENTQ